ncbi:AAC(3) family N-acetyltransferase [Enterovibrio sp. ZSDZ42]|uniref:Aminoglycoside N(3)-acetyltransferase n=1 Tax=Enterovibrio gelatinilyticus TaxID=2899819 RepID=A0ABT5R3M5_9GAMM|nr:AAC(3) family N-acetyltransferase [Enterovibrio sp. ZSDZ42]MDD1794485.1 AAC(3) family N-acetyltransferase [Enterovibrio sp. ZSDZ42]
MNTKDQVKSAIDALSLANKVIFVHASMRSLGQLEGGASTLLNMLLAQGCTVIVPSFNYDTLCYPPQDDNYQQNGHRGEWQFDNIRPFDRNDNRIEVSMGKFAATVVSHQERFRTDHPIGSFAGVGPKAEAVLSHQSDIDVYGHYQYCTNATDAIVLSVGVTLNSITPIHFAEQISGRQLFRRWARTQARGDVEVCVGSCSEGFHQLEKTLQPIATSIDVGLGQWTSYPLAALIQESARAISVNPTITQCAPECPRCQDMAAGGLISTVQGKQPDLFQ